MKTDLNTMIIITGIATVVGMTVLNFTGVIDEIFDYFEREELEKSIDEASCEEIVGFIDYVAENKVRLYFDTEYLFKKYAECTNE